MTGYRHKAVASAWIVMALALSAYSESTAFAQGNAGRETVAILAFESVGASPAEASAITDRLQDLLLGTKKFQLVDRARIDSVLKEQAFQQTGCTSAECAIQVGKVLGVRKLITGKITKLDETHWLISAALIDVESAETLRAPSLPHEGRFFEFLQTGVPILANRLAGEPEPAGSPGSTAKVEQPGPPPQPPPASPAPVKAAEERTGPKKGFAIAVGSGSTSGAAKFSGVRTITYTMQGGGFGLDYQWIASEKISILMFLRVNSGSVRGNAAKVGDATKVYDTGSSTDLGGEARYWIGQAFVGGLLALAGTQMKDSTGANPDISASGTGIGAVGGYEWLSGWHILLSIESANLSGKIQSGVSSTNFTTTESRTFLLAGYRF